MLYTDPLNQFAVQVEQSLRGKPVTFEVGYKEAYAQWEKENETILYKLSAEERTMAFSDYLQGEIADRVKGERSPAAVRGDLLLVSTDEGKRFDKTLTVEEARKEDQTKLRILSPTLRSTSPNLLEVKEEQNMLHVVKNLKDQSFLVDNAWVENHVVHVAATHPRRGSYEVNVPLNQNEKLPLEYTFINAEGKKKVAETQLPEEYGEASADASLQMPTESELMAVQIQSKAQENKSEEDRKKTAALSTFITMMGIQGARHEKQAEAMALSQMLKTKEEMKSPLMHNVMASKAAMSARKARQDKQLVEEKDRMEQREELYKKAAKESYEKMQKEQEKKAKIERAKQSRWPKQLAAGAGVAVVGAAGAGGIFFELAHLANS